MTLSRASLEVLRDQGFSRVKALARKAASVKCGHWHMVQVGIASSGRSSCWGQRESVGYRLPKGKLRPIEKDLVAQCVMIDGRRLALQVGHLNCSKRQAEG